MAEHTASTTPSANYRAPRAHVPARHLPREIRYGMYAGANFELRDLRIREARAIEPGSRRRMYVEFARKHHRLAMQWIADVRRAVTP